MIYQHVNKTTTMLSLATSHIAHKCNQLNHVALPISTPRFKRIIFIALALNCYFCKKMQNFRALGAPPPDPKNSPPHCEFLTTGLLPNISEDQKKVLLSKREAMPLCYMSNTALVIALRS